MALKSFGLGVTRITCAPISLARTHCKSPLHCKDSGKYRLPTCPGRRREFDGDEPS